MLTQTTKDLELFLTDALATGGHLLTQKIHLFTAGPVLNPRMAPGDFTEAAYTGYVAQSLTYGTPYINDALQAAVEAGLITFSLANDLIGPDTIMGYYVTNGAGTILYYAEYFPTPKVLQFAGDAIIFVPGEWVVQTGQAASEVN